jgi:hypothetical protein
VRALFAERYFIGLVYRYHFPGVSGQKATAFRFDMLDNHPFLGVGPGQNNFRMIWTFSETDVFELIPWMEIVVAPDKEVA